MPDDAKKKNGLLGYLLLFPAAAWLTLFFIVPLFTLVSTSLYDPSGSLEFGYQMTGHFANYGTVLQEYSEQFIRSFVYAGTGHRVLPPPRLPARLRDRVQGRPLEEPAAGRW